MPVLHSDLSAYFKNQNFSQEAHQTHAFASISLGNNIAGNDFLSFTPDFHWVCSPFLVPDTGFLRVFSHHLSHSEGLSYNHSEDANASYKAPR